MVLYLNVQPSEKDMLALHAVDVSNKLFLPVINLTAHYDHKDHEEATFFLAPGT